MSAHTALSRVQPLEGAQVMMFDIPAGDPGKDIPARAWTKVNSNEIPKFGNLRSRFIGSKVVSTLKMGSKEHSVKYFFIQ